MSFSQAYNAAADLQLVVTCAIVLFTLACAIIARLRRSKSVADISAGELLRMTSVALGVAGVSLLLLPRLPV